MKKYMIFLFMTVMLLGLTIVSAEESSEISDIQTSISSDTSSSSDNTIQKVSTETKYNKVQTKQSKDIQQTTNKSHELYSKAIEKNKEINNNIKTVSASEELNQIESSTKTKLENAFKQARIEIDNANSTYEKEQVPTSVIDIVKQIEIEAQRAETIYAENQDTSLTDTINKIRNYAGYGDLLVHPEKLTDPTLASKYKTRKLDTINGKYNLLTIVAQKYEDSQDSVYINLSSDEFQNLYNDVGEIHHPGEYDRYGHVQLVSKTKFLQVTPDLTNFELIPFPIARTYLETFYYKNYYYTQTFASSGNTSGGWYHVDGSTLTKSKYLNYTTNTIYDGNSGIVFWKMNKTDNQNMKYVLTDERYYPDINGHPPDNMPKENNDDNGIYFVGYVIKSETGGIHIDGVIVEYRAPDNTYDVNFTVKKVWNDSNNKEGIRPDTITIELLADGERYGDHIVLHQNNGWKHEYVNLPRYNAKGEEIVYTINELTVPKNYKVSYDGYTVINTYIPETTQIEVFKEWDDDHNRDGIRPTSITVDLYANNKLIKSVTINNTNWRYTFTNLPVYNDKIKINYTIQERNINKYTTSIRNISNEYIITNKYIPKTKNVTVKKIWNDTNNQDGIRPTSITIQLLKDNTPYENPIRLNNNNNWTYTFTNLPVNTNGKEITYTAIETSIPEGYTPTNSGLTITNTHIPETTQIEIFKEWDDDHNRDGIRPTRVVVNLLADGKVVNRTVLSSENKWRHNFVDLAVYKNGNKIKYSVEENRVANYTTRVTNINNEFIIKNTHIPLVKELNVLKVWEDNDNLHGIRPNSVKAQLFADGEKYGNVVTISASNNWRYTFTNLPVNFDGKEILYIVKEVTLPEEYYNTIELTGDNEITITNIYDPEHAHVRVIKEWDDNHDSDKLRPSSVQVQLYANGIKQGNPVTLNQSNYWRHSFNNLLKYVNQNEVVYTVSEVSNIPGYTSSVKTLAKNEYAIVNTHSPETINLTVNKVWDDKNNTDGIRPESIKVILLSDGEEYETVTLSENNSWTYTFNDLIKYFDGKQIVYAIEEIGLLEGYNTTYDGYTITNVHTPETLELHVVKEWYDQYNQDGMRPGSISIQLNKNGQVTQTIRLSNNNNWTYIFKNLPKYENGKKIQYTITETKVPNYTTKITNNNSKEIIQNTHTPEKINITIKKVWNDKNNQDGIRPKNIRIVLLNDGEEYKTVTLNKNNNWTYTFTNLDKYNRGKLIKYTTDELGIPEGYTVINKGYIITNLHTPDTIDVYVIVVWDDLEDIDEIRPENVTIILYKDGEPIKNVTTSQDDNWRTIFDNLPKYENGSLIKYTADEVLPNGYTKTIDISEYEIVITNIHRPEIINLTVKKVWNDGDNNDNKRPEKIQVQLLADGKVYATVTLSAADNWEYPFINLPKSRKGVDIVYTVRELSVIEEYSTEIDGYTITNIYSPKTVNITVNVNWDDLNDTDGIRPENVTIILYKDGEPIKNVTISQDDNWRTIFDNLPKYENGSLIKYTADEVLPNGYTKTIDISEYEIVITNIHRPEIINLTVKKVWNDGDNNDNKRPEKIQVQLLADGKVYATVTLSADNNWEYPFINLPKSRHGVDIVYTVRELSVIDEYSTEIDGYTITNIYSPKTVDVNVDIQWDDLDDSEGIRPDNVTIILYKNGEVVKNVTVTRDTWKTSFNNLPKYDEEGNPITYTIDEVVPNGYSKTIEADGNNFIVTNIHRPVRSIKAVVNWDDLNDIDGIRPDTVTLILYADGEEIRTVTISPDDDWNTIFENLPKYNNGNLIEYTVDEVLPNGYKKTITVNDDVITITNIHRPHIIWDWTLVKLVSEEEQSDNQSNDIPINNQPRKLTNKYLPYKKWNVPSGYRSYNKNQRYSAYGKSQIYNSYNWYNMLYRYNIYNPIGWHVISSDLISSYIYRLYIQLYLSGNISFEDFIVILEKEGLSPEIVNFDANGTVTIDYDNIEDVPEEVNVTYKNEDIPTTSDNIDVSNPDNYESPVIDSGNVEVPAKEVQSNNNVERSSYSSSPASNGESNTQLNNVEEE